MCFVSVLFVTEFVVLPEKISFLFFLFFVECVGVHGRKEENVLFNDTFNTFYLRLYGVGHMIKDPLDSERGNPLP